MMKKMWLLLTIFLGGLAAGLFMPAEWRGKISRPLAAGMGRCLEIMPDE